jgi:hypothetical protein
MRATDYLTDQNRQHFKKLRLAQIKKSPTRLLIDSGLGVVNQQQQILSCRLSQRLKKSKVIESENLRFLTKL